MITLKVTSHRDYHGAPILFSVVDDSEEEYGRFPSELEANAFVKGFQAGWASNEPVLTGERSAADDSSTTIV